jgi:hypothetical protein
MRSQAYRDGFSDGWSDARDGRTGPHWPCSAHKVCNHVTDWYAREHAAGYRDGARAYANRRAS